MVNRTHAHFKVTDRSFFAIIKKDIHTLALSANFGESKMGQIDIVVAEIVSNLVKHANGGQLLVKLFETSGVQGIELISIDNGPGMSDVTRMVADGVSTKNTLGHGLGTMKRMSDVFQIYSQKGWGTIILSRIMNKEPAHLKRLNQVEIGSVLINKPGEEVCGDGFVHVSQKGFEKFLLADGLGHGPEAENAALKAIDAFKVIKETEPAGILREMHKQVKKTRGMVGAVVVFNTAEKLWQICGIGNIVTKLHGPSLSKNYMSYNGIIGLNIPNTLNSQQVRYEKGQTMVMCSDGLKSRWDIIQYPTIHRYDPSVISASIFKDFARFTDDMSVAACKINL